MKKLFLLSVKYIPIIQMVGMLFNNIFYYYELIFDTPYIIDYIVGNSLFNTIILTICSYTFMFCNWHRLIIFANFINITIAFIDNQYCIPIDDMELLLSYVIVDIIFIILALYYNFKCKKLC